MDGHYRSNRHPDFTGCNRNCGTSFTLLTRMSNRQDTILGFNRHAFKKYFFNTSWLFAEKILRMAVGLFVGVWVARYLGPERFGLLSYAQSFVGLFSAVAALGLDGIVVRELVKDESRRDELIGTAFWLKLCGAFMVLMLLGIAVHFTSNDHYTNVLIFIIGSATIFQSFNVVDMYFQSRVLSRYIVFANILSLFISSVIKIFLILKQAPLIAFVWVIVFDNFVLALGYVYFYIKNHPAFKIQFLKFNKLTAINLLQDSWPLILSGIVISIYMKIDQIMIKEMLDSYAVGQYAAAVRLSEACYFIPVIITSSLFPAVINAKKQAEELYYQRLQTLFNLMVWISVAIALPVTFLHDWIINLLYTDKFQEAGTVLMIHIWTGIFVFLGVASGKWFLLENYVKKAFYRTSVGALLNIIMNYYLIIRIGIAGAAISTLLANFIAAYLYDLIDKDVRKIFILKTNALLFKKIHVK